jgi:hypothetical protein
MPEMDRLVADVTLQESTAELPATMEAGEAVKEEITGRTAAAGVVTENAADSALLFCAGLMAATL